VQKSKKRWSDGGIVTIQFFYQRTTGFWKRKGEERNLEEKEI